MKYIITENKLERAIFLYIKTYYGELEPVVNDKKTEVHFVDSKGVSRMSGNQSGSLYISDKFYITCAAMFSFNVEERTDNKILEKIFLNFIKNEFGLIFNRVLFYFENQP